MDRRTRALCGSPFVCDHHQYIVMKSFLMACSRSRALEIIQQPGARFDDVLLLHRPGVLGPVVVPGMLVRKCSFTAGSKSKKSEIASAAPRPRPPAPRPRPPAPRERFPRQSLWLVDSVAYLAPIFLHAHNLEIPLWFWWEGVGGKRMDRRTCALFGGPFVMELHIGVS